MAYSSSSSNANSKVHTCSTECEQSYAQLKKLYDTQREQLGDASIEIQAYTQALKKVEAQLVAHQKNQLWYEEKIRFMKIDLDDKTDVLTYHKKLLAEAVKEKEELKTKLESFETSSKSLNTLLNSQLSANDKAGFGHNGAKESKVSETITSVSKVETSNSETSNDKVEMPKIKTVRMSEPIIEEWESDSEDDEIVVKPKEVTKTVKPSFEKIESVNARNETVRQAENPRKNNKSPRGNKRNWNGMMTQKLGEDFEFNNKACYCEWNMLFDVGSNYKSYSLSQPTKAIKKEEKLFVHESARAVKHKEVSTVGVKIKELVLLFVVHTANACIVKTV
ncbi:hypothetical protein Tco_1009337 [Tanacetum coccineum]